MAEFVYLAHGIVEDGGDYAAVAVGGGSGVALAEAEAADESLAGFVQGEFQAHALGIIGAADEAVVFGEFYVAGVVALGLLGHGVILTCGLFLGRLNMPQPTGGQTVVETPCEAIGGAGVPGIPSASLGAGPSTAVVVRVREAQPPLRMSGGETVQKSCF